MRTGRGRGVPRSNLRVLSQGQGRVASGTNSPSNHARQTRAQAQAMRRIIGENNQNQEVHASNGQAGDGMQPAAGQVNQGRRQGQGQGRNRRRPLRDVRDDGGHQAGVQADEILPEPAVEAPVNQLEQDEQQRPVEDGQQIQQQPQMRNHGNQAQPVLQGPQPPVQHVELDQQQGVHAQAQQGHHQRDFHEQPRLMADHLLHGQGMNNALNVDSCVSTSSLSCSRENTSANGRYCVNSNVGISNVNHGSCSHARVSSCNNNSTCTTSGCRVINTACTGTGVGQASGGVGVPSLPTIAVTAGGSSVMNNNLFTGTSSVLTSSINTIPINSNVLASSCSTSTSTISNSMQGLFEPVYQQQVGFTPLVSVCEPLTMSIPKNLKTKIINGEYVDFAVLLEKSDPCRKDDKDEHGMALAVEQGGKIVWKSNKPKQVITSVHAWTSAFLIYMSIYLEAHPSRTQELIRYANLIRTIASRFSGWAWRSYDQQFRARQESHPQRSWSLIDGELWSVYVTSASASPWNTSFRQRGGFRQQTRPRGFGRVENMQAGFRPANEKVCFDFNRQSSCSRKGCIYSHKCSQCKESGHGAVNCKKGK